MKTTKALALAALAVLLSVSAFGQTALTSTTLSAAVTTASQTSFYLASATGVTAPGFVTANIPTGSGQTVLFVDKEAMYVTGINGTYVTVSRGYAGTIAKPHVSGALVYLGPPSYFSYNDHSGACTSTNEVVLPMINITNGNIFDCRSSGQWIKLAAGTMNTVDSNPFRGNCTGTTGSAETEYLNFAACSGATTATTRQVVTNYGTIANLRAYSSAVAVGGANKDVLTVYKNGSATTITCTMAASATTCSDLTHSAAVVPGDVITFQFVTATSDTAANVSATVVQY